MSTTVFKRYSLRPWVLVAAAWIIPAILGAIDTIGQHAVWGGPPLDVREVLFTAGDWFLYALFTPFVFALSRRWPLSRPRLARNIAKHAAMSLVFCVAWASAGTLLRLALQGAPPNGNMLRRYLSWVLTTLPFGAAVYLAMVGIEHAIHYFVEARERDAQLARMHEQLTNAKLAALQARLNPHFLFNALNTVAVLVRDDDRARATHVIEQLSDVLRRTLSRSHDAEVSLGEELELVRQYLAVEQARFSDRLVASINIPPALYSAAVPSFALQHLVENAIRHGIARRSDAGRIAIDARRAGDMLELSVADDGAGMRTAEPTRGHGLDDTRERLRTLYGGDASLELLPVEPFGTRALLRIPYKEMLLGGVAHANG